MLLLLLLLVFHRLGWYPRFFHVNQLSRDNEVANLLKRENEMKKINKIKIKIKINKMMVYECCVMISYRKGIGLA